MELVFTGESEQRVVGNAAPQKEREPRRKFKIADPIRLAGLQAGRLGFLTENEFRIDQDAPQRHLDAAIKIRALPALLIESHKHIGVSSGYRPAERPPGESAHDLAGTGGLLGRGGRLADEDLFAALRLAGAFGVIRTVDCDLSDMRKELEPGQAAGFDRA